MASNNGNEKSEKKLERDKEREKERALLLGQDSGIGTLPLSPEFDDAKR